MLLLVSVVLLLAVPGCCGLWTVDRLVARHGGSVTIPCHYNTKFRMQVKYWCKGKNWHTCITVRESARVNITDSPAELVATLTLSGLQMRDAGRYWCALQRGGFLKSNIRTSLELQVTEDIPDLWVNSSSVSGTEGGNVSMKCFYSDQLKEDEKKWCRSGDLHSCQSEQDTNLSQHAKLQLRDEGQGFFTVTLTALHMDDGGWYWCMAGGIQSPVHLTVTALSSVQNHTDWTSLPHSSTASAPITMLTSTHRPSNSIHSTHSKHTHSTWTLSTSTHVSARSSSVSMPSPDRTPTTQLFSSPTAVPKRPLAVPTGSSVTVTCAASRLYVWLLVTLGILLTAAVVMALIWRRQKHHRGNHMMVEEVEPSELSVKDDVDLLDHEWTNRTVLKLEEQPNITALV